MIVYDLCCDTGHRFEGWFGSSDDYSDQQQRGLVSCPECGSAIMSYLEEMPALRFVKAGAMDDSSWLQTNSSFWSKSAQHWSPVDSSCEAVPENPTM